MPNFAVHKLKRHFSANCPTKGCNRTTCFSPAEVLSKALLWKSQDRSTSFKVLIRFRLLYYFFIEMFLYQTWKQYIFLICTREIMLSILEVMLPPTTPATLPCKCQWYCQDDWKASSITAGFLMQWSRTWEARWWCLQSFWWGATAWEGLDTFCRLTTACPAAIGIRVCSHGILFEGPQLLGRNKISLTRQYKTIFDNKLVNLLGRVLS